MHINWKILFLISTVKISSCSSLILESPSDKFLSHLSQNLFPHCSLFFIREGEDYSDTLSYLGDGNRKLISYQNMKFNSLEEDKPSDKPNKNLTLKKSFSLESLSLSKAGKVIQTDGTGQPTFGEFFPSTIKKLSPPCRLIILLIKSPRIELLQNIHKIFCPNFRSTIQMDLDYFIFQTPAHLLEETLLMPEWPAKIKFKLGIGISDDKQGGEEDKSLSKHNNNNQLFKIKSICLFCEEGKPLVINLDPLESNWGLFGDEYFPDYVQNMNGAILRISAPLIPCRVELPRPYNKFHDRLLRGMWKDLYDDYLIYKFNFTIKVFIASGVDGKPGVGEAGRPLPNGTWTGTIGDLLYGRADSTADNGITSGRVEVVAFSSFVDMTYFNFMTTEGQRIYTPMAVLWPFGPLMWSLILGSCAISFVIFHLITTFTSRMGLSSGDDMSYAHRGVIVKKDWGLGHQLFFIVNSFLEQDAELPRFTPFRCFVALWLIYAMILTCVYRSILVGLLAFPPAEQIPTTFGELAFSEYQVGYIANGDAGLNTFKRSKDPVYIKLLQRMEIIPGKKGLTCMENVINKPRYGCIAFDICSRFVKAKNMSDGDVRKLIFSRATTYNMYMAIGYAPGSMYRGNFDKYVGIARSVDLPNYWDHTDFYGLRVAKNNWWKETNQNDKLKEKDSLEESGRLKYKQVSGGFFILFLGIGISSLALAGELINLHKERLKMKGEGMKRKLGLQFNAFKDHLKKAFEIFQSPKKKKVNLTLVKPEMMIHSSDD